MKIAEVKANAFAMPLTSPAFPRGPYRFINREYLIITYRTDLDAWRAVVPEPLEIIEPVVKYEFIRMPVSTGFGDYTESGQVIPVRFKGVKGSYVHSMYLNDHPPIAGGRELCGFPKKLASPALDIEIDTLVGTLDYGKVCVAKATMGYKHSGADQAAVLASLAPPNFLLKIIPHVDGGTYLRIGTLLHNRRHAERRMVWPRFIGAPPPHSLAPLSELPALKIESALHFVADLTLDLGEVVYDYLIEPRHDL
ncbi:acetoacetate decarboxylase [Chitinimonas sp. BJB300]|uniref:acetoacetate decarboxylase n=1 Tax=Chitinimonas sp. BJB300 TaxID=1559339 RepID=UPI000C1114EA|nr:acetoacetate decarboxylase [Chitinimonas sp. BJB300]PHV10030.1 acetoacetate decarboxylase [Chitinimonas sp. BJB300]TSJ90140.1 acetoacetate decarboxylase [Chitinimonas sp. BJB300]